MADVLRPLARGQNDPPNWVYYAQDAASLWTAPNAILSICGGIFYDADDCQNTPDWQNVVTPAKRNGDLAGILTDIEHCALPKVSWVVPDGHWSDHPGYNPFDTHGPHDGGPSWVAAIVNDVGDATTCDSGAGYWSDTVIFVVWDDWGGFYDHVAPYRCDKQTGVCLGYPNQTGGQYLYGFRVPFLAVGKYVRQGYISGTPSQGGEVAPYIHDFGSILNFIEYTFGSNGAFLGQIESQYPYADHWAPDVFPQCPQGQCPYSLSDFFDFGGPGHDFVRITPTKYDKGCFHNGSCFSQNFVAADPDDDAIDDQD